MALDDAQRIFAEILSKNLAGKTVRLKPIKPLGKARALPRGVKVSQFLNPPPMPQIDRPQNDLASYSLFHTTLGKPKGFDSMGQSLASKQEDEEPGFLTRIFDTLAIPGNLYMNQLDNIVDITQGEQSIGGAIKDQAQEVLSGGARFIDNMSPRIPVPFTNVDDRIYDAIEGQADKADRTFGSDVLGNLGVKNKYGKILGGLALDIVTDPLNAVGVGIVGKGRRAVSAIDELTAAATGVGKQAARNNPSVFTRAAPKPRPQFAPVAEDILGGGSRIPGLRPVRQQQFDLPHVSVPGGRRMTATERTMRFRGLADEARNTKITDTSAVAGAMRSANAQHAAKSRHLGPKYDELEDLPDYAPSDKNDFYNFMRDKQMAKHNKVADPKHGISPTAIERAIDSIRKGDIPRTGKDLPETIDNPITAKTIADDFLDKSLGKKAGKKVDFKPSQQVNLYNRIYAATAQLAKNAGHRSIKSKAAKQYREAEAMKMLRTAENHLIRLGRQPQFWNGMRVRLSDVISSAHDNGVSDLSTVLTNFGKSHMDQIDDLGVKAAIETNLARRSLTDGEVIGQIGDLIAQSRQAMLAGYKSKPEVEVASGALIKTAEEAGRAANLSPKELEALKDVVRQIVDVDKLGPEMTIDKLGPELMAAAASGRADATVINKTMKSIVRMFGANQMDNVIDDVSGSGAVDAFMATFTTWWGRGELKRFADDVIIWGERNAEDTAAMVRNVTKNYSKEEQANAWSVLTGRIPGVDPRAAALAAVWKKQIDYMLGSSGFGDELMSKTVAVKAQVLMEDLNKQLKRTGIDYFQFRNGKKVDAFNGETRDYSKGADWLKSWENANPKDPSHFLYNMQLAMERLTKQYAFIDNFGAKFGSPVKTATHTEIYPHPRLDGKYFPKELRNQFARVMDDFDSKMWQLNSKPLQWIARGTRAWKSQVTIYNLVHHVRNMVGDSWLMWMDGINDPLVYTKAANVIKTQKVKYKGIIKEGKEGTPEAAERAFAGLGRVHGPDAMRQASQVEPKLSDIVLKVGKNRITNEQIWIGMHQRGLLLDANRLEDILGEVPLGKLTGMRPFGGKVHGAASALSEYREHYVRTAHFIGALKQELRGGRVGIKEAMDEAAHRVRKWHPDGRDLTDREQTLRLIIPFYSWMRKSTPLVLQSMVQRPAKVIAYPRVHNAMQQLLGIDATMEDPFPDDQLFPDWIRSSGMGPLGDPTQGGITGLIGNLGRTTPDFFTGEPTGYTNVDPGNPLNDFVEQFGGTGKPNEPLMGLLESINPGIRIPFEVATGNKVTGAPISNDVGGYITEQIPAFAPASRITNFGLGGPTRQAEQDGTHFDKEALINWMTGAGVRGSGPYIKQAEFEAKERAKKAAERRLSRGN